MKIGVSSTGKNLSQKVDPRFGRCRYFLIVDDNTMDFEAIPNDSAMASGGAGIQAAQTLARAGAKVLITGNIGPNAFQTLSAAGIKIITGVDGTVKEAIENYKNGKLVETKSHNVGSHFGRG